MLLFCKSNHSTPKMITGHYIITLRSAFGQAIEVRYSPSLLLLCTHGIIQCSYIYNINIRMKCSYLHFRWQWCLHNSRSNHWSHYCTVTSHYLCDLLFSDKERYVCYKCVLNVFNMCINITIFVQYCITVDVEVTV